MNIRDDRQEHECGQQIDAALGLLARVEPRAGLERRVRARLAEEKRRPARRGFQRIAVGFVASVASFAIVFGTVWHSHQAVLPQAPVRLGIRTSGIGAASAARIPAQPVPAPAKKHGRWERKHTKGRAELKGVPPKAAGVEPAPPDVRP